MTELEMLIKSSELDWELHTHILLIEINCNIQPISIILQTSISIYNSQYSKKYD